MMMLKTSDKPELSFLFTNFSKAGYLDHKVKIIKKKKSFFNKVPNQNLYLNPKQPPENLLK